MIFSASALCAAASRMRFAALISFMAFFTCGDVVLVVMVVKVVVSWGWFMILQMVDRKLIDRYMDVLIDQSIHSRNGPVSRQASSLGSIQSNNITNTKRTFSSTRISTTRDWMML
jgi:hypothetical protein